MPRSVRNALATGVNSATSSSLRLRTALLLQQHTSLSRGDLHGGEQRSAHVSEEGQEERPVGGAGWAQT